jgi:hypothetical protein
MRKLITYVCTESEQALYFHCKTGGTISKPNKIKSTISNTEVGKKEPWFYSNKNAAILLCSVYVHYTLIHAWYDSRFGYCMGLGCPLGQGTETQELEKRKTKRGNQRTTAYLVHATIISPENVTPATLAVRSPQLTTSVM